MPELTPASIARTAALAATLLAPAAFAHTGQGGAHDFLGGLLHPLTGFDHALAMIGVGALAWSLGGRARLGLPAGFLAMLSIGMLPGFAGIVLPQVEMAVAASVAAMGLMLFAGRRLPPALVLGLVCIFGVLHGNAHGAEMQAAGSLPRGAGFLFATAGLHAAGFALGSAVSRLRGWLAGRPARSPASR